MSVWVGNAAYTAVIYNGDLIAGGISSDGNNIGKWNGSLWQPLGSGINGQVNSLTVYNGELITAGGFLKAGGVTVNRIARWDGSEWRAFGNGLDGTGGETYVYGLTVYKDELIAGGWFPTAAGIDVNKIARWNGNEWHSLGSGINNSLNSSGIVFALTIYNGELIAGGGFLKVGGVDANSVARWDGSNWRPLGSGVASGIYPYSSVRSLTVYNGELMAGGDFNTAEGIDANGIAAWDGEEWHSLGSGIRVRGPGGMQVSYGVRALAVYNGELIAGGDFNVAGGVDVNGIARWDGNSWQPLGSGISGLRFFVGALAVYDGKLIAGGSFTKAGGIDVNNIASWDGNSWQPLGSGLNN